MPEYINKLIFLLGKNYPNAKIVLNYSNNWELLVAVILSAQSTDVTINKVTNKLFGKYKDVADYAKAPMSQLAKDIKSSGFYRAKAKNIVKSAQIILKDFGGRVPDTMVNLVKLPGVARKTANIVLGNAYGKVEGIAVDTHVRRLAQRLGLTKQHDPVKIEQDLMRLFPKKVWFKLTYWLIDHGRAVCQAKKPKCDQCFLAKICPSAFKFPHFSAK